ncbi:MAG: hypothetical protein ACOY0T_08820 [Myxococcota bacterium]
MRFDALAIRRLLGVYGLVLLATLLISAWRLNELTLGSAARGAWLPFLRPLLGAGFEVSLLLAVPAALLAARAAGLSIARCAFAFALLSAIGVLAATRLDPGGLAPGQLAEALLREARDRCEMLPSRRADVPLIGMTWSCPAGAPATLTGRVPIAKRAEFSAGSIQLAPDLRTISLSELELSLPATLKRGPIHVSAQRAVIRGLSPWGRPADVPLARRLLRAVLAALATSAAGIAALLYWRWGQRATVGIALLAGLAAFATQRWLDRYTGPGVWYFGLVLVGPIAVGLAGLATNAINRFFRRSTVAR